jgi:hypothetical protein
VNGYGFLDGFATDGKKAAALLTNGAAFGIIAAQDASKGRRAMKWNDRHTLCASYLGYITQAIINNLPPLLFLTFQRTLGISLERISLLITINFSI